MDSFLGFAVVVLVVLAVYFAVQWWRAATDWEDAVFRLGEAEKDAAVAKGIAEAEAKRVDRMLQEWKQAMQAPATRPGPDKVDRDWERIAKKMEDVATEKAGMVDKLYACIMDFIKETPDAVYLTAENKLVMKNRILPRPTRVEVPGPSGATLIFNGIDRIRTEDGKTLLIGGGRVVAEFPSYIGYLAVDLEDAVAAKKRSRK